MSSIKAKEVIVDYEKDLNLEKLNQAINALQQQLDIVQAQNRDEIILELQVLTDYRDSFPVNNGMYKTKGHELVLTLFSLPISHQCHCHSCSSSYQCHCYSCSSTCWPAR